MVDGGGCRCRRRTGVTRRQGKVRERKRASESPKVEARCEGGRRELAARKGKMERRKVNSSPVVEKLSR